jgi:hypothetical protein
LLVAHPRSAARGLTTTGHRRCRPGAAFSRRPPVAAAEHWGYRAATCLAAAQSQARRLRANPFPIEAAGGPRLAFAPGQRPPEPAVSRSSSLAQICVGERAETRPRQSRPPASAMISARQLGRCFFTPLGCVVNSSADTSLPDSGQPRLLTAMAIARTGAKQSLAIGDDSRVLRLRHVLSRSPFRLRPAAGRLHTRPDRASEGVEPRVADAGDGRIPGSSYPAPFEDLKLK